MRASLLLGALGLMSVDGRSSATCTPSGCSMSCSNGKSYDLSGFVSNMPSGGYYDAKDKYQHDYYFTPCEAISKVTCSGSTVGSDSFSIQTWGGTPPHFTSGTCASIGKFSTQTCTALAAGTPPPGGPPDATGEGVQCKYTGGDVNRKGSITYYCAKTYSTATADQPGSLEYDLTIFGPAGCEAAAGGKGGLSDGWLFIILLFVGIVVYLGGGIGYNVKYKAMQPGVEAIPFIEYWKELPGLVKDGCQFSKEQTMIAYEFLKDKYQGSPNDPTLKQSLAKAEEGGDEGGSSDAKDRA